MAACKVVREETIEEVRAPQRKSELLQDRTGRDRAGHLLDKGAT